MQDLRNHAVNRRVVDIQKAIGRIVQQATRALWVCDGYMDEKIVEELTVVPAAEMRLLTHTVKGLFQQRVAAFRAQFPARKLDVRSSAASHDRFYVIDEDQVWTLGASLNQAGKKATLLSKIKSQQERGKMKSDFETWWKSGKPLG